MGIARSFGQRTKILLAVQPQRWEYDLNQGSVVVQRSAQDSGLDDLLTVLGTGVEPKVLMDEQTLSVRVARSQVDQVFGGGIDLNLPIHIVLTKNAMNSDEPITARLENLYLWGSALKLDYTVLKEQGINATVLASSSQRSWLMDPPVMLTHTMIAPPQDGSQKAYPVAVCLRGQFPPNTGPIPEHTNPGQNGVSEQSLEGTHRPGELVFIGSAVMFGNDLLEHNIDFLLNTVDYLVFGPDLLQIRGKKQVSRVIFDITPQQAMVWKVLAYCLPSLCIAICAGLHAWARLRRRYVFAQTMRNRS